MFSPGQLLGSLPATSLLDPGHLLATVGLAGCLAIVFAECGLLLGFFLPGDTLLFTAGLLIAKGSPVLPRSIVLVCLLVSVAAVAGNLAGYWIGRQAGPAVFRRENSRLFRPEYVDRTTHFFAKYGGTSILLARFVPVVRTFITVMAGVGRMDLRLYATFSVVGGLLWGTGVTLLGYWLGQYAFVTNHIELILVGMVLLSVLPIWFELHRRTRGADS
jgi:membrane-associated protein